MKFPKGALEANMARARAEREAKKILVPIEFLTALQKRGQDGEQVLRGRKSAKSK